MAKARPAQPTRAVQTIPAMTELANLYRSIGIPSVASAVAAQKMVPVALPVRRDVPPLLRKDRAFD
jgi:hypothetical protein